ncbi:hypothetical protein NLM33_10550 [Bradyrhizobium sp. CCGUVB1N3]|uniref:hypothetical protein n=1 Tax=Bradyrhizobium sp. CCGUVB1N3 TaxID=2949629 RepID=UPI0020B2B28A|nr:hypothetical protein [Bradyrhizobium sp. CCGUVB1N3]MCP3470759.1 hypothetical protein [Bradyrhizobium sp. CCGUVB1N3]
MIQIKPGGRGRCLSKYVRPATADISDMSSVNIAAGSSILRDELVEVVLLRREAGLSEVHA